ncbi:unnamed protein product [Blepharisma stoltei]|uniref:Uncharacterized protein n=1 Tax=Blepharisma stoltei TaxID=1481888 RepID=A0AAU9K6M1_9CILI|nr:unnamed protein product [Blepharisma stoltei]
MLEVLEWYYFIVGLWTAIKIGLEVYYACKSLLSRPSFLSYGSNSWVLVTGASDGIGFGFTEYLACQGFNIILIGRNPNKTHNAARYLEEKFPIKTKCIIKDFSLCTENPIEFFTDIKEQTRDLDISILINNVGYGHAFDIFASLKEDDNLSTNAINIWSITFLTKLYLPDMISRKQKSAIINVSSITSQSPLVKSSLYAASKSFGDLFSLITTQEAKYLANNSTNIDVLSLRPGFVDTPLTQKFTRKPLLVSVNECISYAWSSIGRVDYTSGHWKHQFLYLAARVNETFLSIVMGNTELKWPTLSRKKY